MSTQADTTRDAIIRAAIRVLTANPAASLSEIAEGAGVKRVTLHRLIGTRDDLLQEIAVRSLEEMDVACEQACEGAKSSLEALHNCVKSLVPVGDRFHFLWTQAEVWEAPNIKKEVARQNEELSRLIDAAKSEDAIDSAVPTKWIMAAIESIVYTALITARAGDIAVNDAGELAVRTLFHGIQKRPHGKRGKKKP